MIYPIVAYGDPVLRQEGEEVSEDYPGLQELIDGMIETMKGAHGVGLAAPQVGKSLRLFVVDTSGFLDAGEEDPEDLKNFREVFINPEIVERSEKGYLFNEGCLSIPEVRGDVDRPEEITIKYRDRNFEEKTETFNGMKARVIQHEYDHIEGVLFTDHLTPLRKSMLKKRLNNISTGKVQVAYKMKFPALKR